MLNNKKIKNLGYCRSCINDVYGLNLKKEDVFIYEFPGQCKNCKRMGNIVAQVRPSKTWKLIGARESDG